MSTIFRCQDSPDSGVIFVDKKKLWSKASKTVFIKKYSFSVKGIQCMIELQPAGFYTGRVCYKPRGRYERPDDLYIPHGGFKTVKAGIKRCVIFSCGHKEADLTLTSVPDEDDGRTFKTSKFAESECRRIASSILKSYHK